MGEMPVFRVKKTMDSIPATRRPRRSRKRMASAVLTRAHHGAEEGAVPWASGAPRHRVGQDYWTVQATVPLQLLFE
jgi:hypothetical protein